MKAPEHRSSESAATRPGTDGGAPKSAASAPSERGVEAYPYDPALRPHEQSGLDRLRCIQDRELAAVLYRIYVLTERKRHRAAGSTAAPGKPSPRASSRRENTIGLRVLATRALAGELGFAAQELAMNLLIDDAGRELADERSLREFARAFQTLAKER